MELFGSFSFRTTFANKRNNMDKRIVFVYYKKMTENKYSVKKIISHDYITLCAFITLIVTAAISLEVYFFGYMISTSPLSIELLLFEERLLYVYVSGGLALLGLICFIVRMNIIKNLFSTGIEVKGKIVELKYWRDRGIVTYVYFIEGQEYCKHLRIHITKETSNLGKDDEVQILVRPENHSKSIIKDLFIER